MHRRLRRRTSPRHLECRSAVFRESTHRSPATDRLPETWSRPAAFVPWISAASAADRRSPAERTTWRRSLRSGDIDTKTSVHRPRASRSRISIRNAAVLWDDVERPYRPRSTNRTWIIANLFQPPRRRCRRFPGQFPRTGPCCVPRPVRLAPSTLARPESPGNGVGSPSADCRKRPKRRSFDFDYRIPPGRGQPGTWAPVRDVHPGGVATFCRMSIIRRVCGAGFARRRRGYRHSPQRK